MGSDLLPGNSMKVLERIPRRFLSSIELFSNYKNHKGIPTLRVRGTLVRRFGMGS